MKARPDPNKIEEELTEEAKENLKKAFEQRKCTKCMHFPVCQLYKNFNPLVDEMFKDNDVKPVESEDLAKICSLYVPTAGR